MSKQTKKFKKRLAGAKEGNNNNVVLERPHPSEGVPVWNTAAFIRLLQSKKWVDATQAVCDFLCFFEKNQYLSYGKDDIRSFDSFITSVCLMLTNPEYMIDGQYAFRLVSCGHIFSNIVSVSSYDTTDFLLKQLINEGNLVKLAFCQNSRAKIQAKVSAFFDANPTLASLWYNTYLLGVGAVTPLQQDNLHRHVKDCDPRWVPLNSNVSCPMFTSTYFNQQDVKRAKILMNQSIANLTKSKPYEGTPDPLHIGIFTSKWHRNHAVYKSAGPQVEQLLDKYKLTLVHLGPQVPDTLVKDYFDKVYSVAFDRDHKLVVPTEVMKNDFQLIFYPDIGMVDEGIWLSNQRLAPIQCVGYGHPDTTAATQIDYMIGGDVERDCAEWYTEKLVLIPGLAQQPAIPTAPRQYNWEPSEKVRINCVWGPDKYNSVLLKVLAEINRHCGTDKHEYRFFPSPGVNRYAGVAPFLRDIRLTLPNVHVHTDIEYYDYMVEAERNDFSINSFPFGGYNTVVESYYLGLPCVTMRGNRFYSRAGSYLNQQIGMPEMDSDNVVDFISIICKMIQDDAYRAAERAKLAAIDLQEVLFKRGSKTFLTAIDHIIANHPLQTNPTLIGEIYGDSL